MIRYCGQKGRKRKENQGNGQVRAFHSCSGEQPQFRFKGEVEFGCLRYYPETSHMPNLKFY